MTRIAPDLHEIEAPSPLLVVDDVSNTGHSIMQTLEVLRRAGGIVVGAGCLVTRGNFQDYGVPFISLAEVHLSAWDESECHLCRENVPVNTKYAHGADYLRKRSAPPAV